MAKRQRQSKHISQRGVHGHPCEMLQSVLRATSSKPGGPSGVLTGVGKSESEGYRLEVALLKAFLVPERLRRGRSDTATSCWFVIFRDLCGGVALHIICVYVCICIYASITCVSSFSSLSGSCSVLINFCTLSIAVEFMPVGSQKVRPLDSPQVGAPFSEH